MSRNILAMLLLMAATTSFCQNQRKTLFGSFVFNNEVYQYKYKKDGSIHTLQLSDLARTSVLSNLDANKLNKTIDFLKETTKKENSKRYMTGIDSAYFKGFSEGVIDTITELPNFLIKLKEIKDNQKTWEAQLKSIDKLIDIFKQYKIENIKLADTTVSDIYGAEELLVAYKDFLDNNKEPQHTKEVPFPELKQEEFRTIFKKQLLQLSNLAGKDFIGKDDAITKISDEIMYQIKARVEFKDDEPVTAYMILKRKYIELPVRYKLKNDTIKKPYREYMVNFEIKNMSVEFEDGGIKTIFADLLPILPEYSAKYGDNTIRFRNNKPISIIGKFDPDIFREHKIYLGNTLELLEVLYDKMNKERKSIKDTLDSDYFFNTRKTKNISFTLSHLLDYKVVSETDNEDYSPTNSKIELSETHAIEELKKEKRSNILSARAFSDFMGLGGDLPNGLVQLEVSKKISILSGRRQGFLFFGNENQRGIYSGGLTFIEPKVTISKIEENNRYLKLDSVALDRVKSLADSSGHFRLNPLDVLQFQQWSFGLDVNILKLNLLNRKSNFQINGSLNFGRTSASDSLKISNNKVIQIQSQNTSRISTTTYGIGILYEVKPDTRYGFSIGFDMKWIDILNKQYDFNPDFKNRIYTAWFNGFFKVNDDSKMFWRFRKNWIMDNNKSNYYQIQIGYELDIFKGAK